MRQSAGTRGKAPFEAIVAEHGATVLRVCRAGLRGHADADDAWSETFLAALRAWPRLPSDANVEAWLVTIARRKVVDLQRRRAREAAAVEPAALEAVGAHAGGPAHPVRRGPTEPEAAADLLDLQAALARLPERQRWAVVCHHLIGMPYAEVAEVLESTPAAARRSAADGMAGLRRILTPGSGRRREQNDDDHDTERTRGGR